VTSLQNNPADADATELGSRFTVIEELPLEGRAEAFVHVHDELLARLEGADVPAGGEA